MRFATSYFGRSLLMVTAGLLSLLSASAVAQEARGQFTLATQVHWGRVVLPPGDYRYSLESRAGSPVLMVWNTAGTSGFLVMPVSASRTTEGEMNRLDLERRGKDLFVASLVMPEVETTIHFLVPPAGGEVARGSTTRKTMSMMSP